MIHSNRKGFLESKAKFSSHLVTGTISVFFICLFSTSPSLRTLLLIPREASLQEIEESICHNDQKSCSLRVRAHVIGKMIEIHGVFIHYLLFLPFIWHSRDPFSQCKRKTWRDKHKFCSYELACTLIAIIPSSEQPQAVRWLVDIFYGIWIITWCFLWWKRGNMGLPVNLIPCESIFSMFSWYFSILSYFYSMIFIVFFCCAFLISTKQEVFDSFVTTVNIERERMHQPEKRELRELR